LSVPIKNGRFLPNALIDYESKRILIRYDIPADKASWWMCVSLANLDLKNSVLAYDYIIKTTTYPQIDYSYIDPQTKHISSVHYKTEEGKLDIFTIYTSGALVSTSLVIPFDGKKGGHVVEDGYTTDSNNLYITRIFQSELSVSRVELRNGDPRYVDQYSEKVSAGTTDSIILSRLNTNDLIMAYTDQNKELRVSLIDSDSMDPLDSKSIATNSVLLSGYSDKFVYTMDNVQYAFLFHVSEAGDMFLTRVGVNTNKKLVVECMLVLFISQYILTNSSMWIIWSIQQFLNWNRNI
jgi:hypothetical protein